MTCTRYCFCLYEYLATFVSFLGLPTRRGAVSACRARYYASSDCRLHPVACPVGRGKRISSSDALYLILFNNHIITTGGGRGLALGARRGGDRIGRCGACAFSALGELCVCGRGIAIGEMRRSGRPDRTDDGRAGAAAACPRCRLAPRTQTYI